MTIPVETIETITGSSVESTQRLHGGMIGDVYRVLLDNGDSVVAKIAGVEQGTLHIEGEMLLYLRQHSDLPVPEVLHHSRGLLLMSYIPGESTLRSVAVQQHAAELVAGLHQNTSDTVGLDFDTLIGPLHQPNPRMDSWVDFFREQRLLYMARVALESGKLPATMMQRVERFAGKLDRYLDEPDTPVLIHGDIWTTNVLVQNDRVTGFIDPAIYYAHREMELAYTNLFGTMGEAFFRRYNEIHPIAPGFFETRSDIYNLYPLLVHVRIFGGGYTGSVSEILQHFGY